MASMGEFRKRLVEEKWTPDLISREIPMSEGVQPLDVLADGRSKARWANEGVGLFFFVFNSVF